MIAFRDCSGGDCHRGAFGREPTRDRFADAAASARHERDTPIELHGTTPTVASRENISAPSCSVYAKHGRRVVRWLPTAPTIALARSSLGGAGTAPTAEASGPPAVDDVGLRAA